MIYYNIRRWIGVSHELILIWEAKKANVMSNKLCKVPSMLLWSHYTQHFIPVVQFFGEKITGHNAKTSYYYCFWKYPPTSWLWPKSNDNFCPSLHLVLPLTPLKTSFARLGHTCKTFTYFDTSHKLATRNLFLPTFSIRMHEFLIHSATPLCGSTSVVLGFQLASIWSKEKKCF